MIVCRSTNPLERSVKEKISMFGMVPSNHVFSVHDVGNIYEVYLDTLLCIRSHGKQDFGSFRMRAYCFEVA